MPFWKTGRVGEGCGGGEVGGVCRMVRRCVSNGEEVCVEW